MCLQVAGSPGRVTWPLWAAAHSHTGAKVPTVHGSSWPCTQDPAKRHREPHGWQGAGPRHPPPSEQGRPAWAEGSRGREGSPGAPEKLHNRAQQVSLEKEEETGSCEQWTLDSGGVGTRRPWWRRHRAMGVWTELPAQASQGLRFLLERQEGGQRGGRDRAEGRTRCVRTRRARGGEEPGRWAAN